MSKKSTKPMTQKEQVLKHMRKYGSISTWEAFGWYKITRLSARIADLEADGYQIKHTPEVCKLLSGRTTTITRYSLKRGKK